MFIICFIRSVLLTLRLTAFPFEPFFSGHEFHAQNDGSLKCTVCGKVSK